MVLAAFLSRMQVSAATRDLCRATFTPPAADLGIRAQETYAGAEADWVHEVAMRLSEGHLRRLDPWLNSAEREPDTFRRYADGTVESSPAARVLAVEFINGLLDQNVPQHPLGPHS